MNIYKHVRWCLRCGSKDIEAEPNVAARNEVPTGRNPAYGHRSDHIARSNMDHLSDCRLSSVAYRSPALEHSKLKCLYAALKKKQIFAVGGDIQQRSAIDPTKRM